uniref:Uncharacterized protein n=1 Tax=Siphoviridae sp. ctNxi14 TaxID=2825475 RepID=A0A8S5VHH4_9CAUD|nr:MAG TPA: hypothetical protein [Siphoviridae sp. ctNxi14]
MRHIRQNECIEQKKINQKGAKFERRIQRTC